MRFSNTFATARETRQVSEFYITFACTSTESVTDSNCSYIRAISCKTSRHTKIRAVTLCSHARGRDMETRTVARSRAFSQNHLELAQSSPLRNKVLSSPTNNDPLASNLKTYVATTIWMVRLRLILLTIDLPASHWSLRGGL